MDASRSRAAEPEALHVNRAAAGAAGEVGPAASAAPVTPSGAVVAEGGPNRWFVASRSNPGAWWAVERLLVHGRPGPMHWEVRCPCPWGASQLDLPLGQRVACRHLKALVAYQNEAIRASVRRSPVNVSAMVD